MSKGFWIKHDGVVGHWLRWHLLMIAFATLLGFLLNGVWAGVAVLFDIRGPRELIDWHIILFTIPLGILWGDGLYEKDRAANELLERQPHQPLGCGTEKEPLV